jgi:hypothetical protein
MKISAVVPLLMAFPALFLQAEETGPAMSQDELSAKATDPTASLLALNFQGIHAAGYHGDGFPGEPADAWSLQFRPVIPFNFLGHPNILRATIPYQISGRGDEGFGPVTLFDLVVFPVSWGRWGIGPVMSFDTTGAAPDGFVLGPAVGGVWQVNKKVNLGLFSQNVFGGDTAVTSWQPVIAYQLGSGWSLSAGDLQFTYDWEAGRWVDLPVGFQVGKVTKIGGLPCRFAVNPQYNLKNDRGLSDWSVAFTFTALFPTL